MVKSLWKREFRRRFMNVEHHRPDQFIRSQWQNKSQVDVIYLTYRWLMAVMFLVTMICSICDAGRNDNLGVRYIKWGIYLTNWGYTLCTIQALLSATLLTHQCIAERRKASSSADQKEMPITYKVYWVMHTIAVVTAFGITIVYWVAIYNPALHTLDALNLCVHAFNSVFMLIDLFVVGHPFRLLHCYWPVLFTTCYIIFSVIYYEAGGTDRHDRPFVYPILDWRIPRRTVVISICGLLFLIVVHSTTWLLFLLRKRLATIIFKKNLPQQTESTVPSPMQTTIPMDSILC